MDESPFNADELTAQSLAGGGPRGSAIWDFMPEQHRRFFAQLPNLYLGAIDAGGWPLATLLVGKPGFIASADAVSLHIAALPDPLDPAADALVAGRDIGLLGLDFSTRRRNRANGRITSRDLGGISVTVSQSFGNCPQYIQRRATVATLDECRTGSAQNAPHTTEAFEHLDAAAQTAIGQADTFFVASHSRPGNGPAFGADISHRGGRPGFVRVEGDELTIPDFRGNRYFNTLGNLASEPRASLLFIDFSSGDLLQLQGIAKIEWNAETAQFSGAERLWHFHVVRGWRRKAASALRWRFEEYARTTLQTGSWRAAH